MKTHRSNLAEFILLSVLGALTVCSLVIPQLIREKDEPRLLSLSVLFRSTDSSGWTVTRQGMEQAADELGAELRFLTLTAPDDGGEQEELVRREAEGGADALVVIPASPFGLSGTLERQPLRCPVVTLESPLEGGAGVVAPDDALLGRRLAEALLADWDGGGVLLLDSGPAGSGITARLEAALETLTEAGAAVSRAEALPEGRVSERWVMAFEPGATLRSAEKKESEGQDYVLYGVGGSTAVTARLERGTVAAVAAWSDYAAGYLAVSQAVAAVQGGGEKLEPLPFSILRGEDIYEPENQKLLLPVTS